MARRRRLGDWSDFREAESKASGGGGGKKGGGGIADVVGDVVDAAGDAVGAVVGAAGDATSAAGGVVSDIASGAYDTAAAASPTSSIGPLEVDADLPTPGEIASSVLNGDLLPGGDEESSILSSLLDAPVPKIGGKLQSKDKPVTGNPLKDIPSLEPEPKGKGQLKSQPKKLGPKLPKIEGITHGPAATEFAQWLSHYTRFDPQVVGAWVQAEGGGYEGSGVSGGEAGRNNWLGVGYPGYQTEFAKSDYFNKDPKTAAKATADWIKGKIGSEYDYHAAPSIEEFGANAAGGSADDFLRAFETSEWGTGTENIVANLPNISVSGSVRGAPGSTLISAPDSSGPLKGPYEGSRRFVSRLLGQPVHGDKEYGHSSGGMHQPVEGGGKTNAYAQDIGSSYTEGNPAEGEPPYSEETVDTIVRNIQKAGGDIPDPDEFSLGENWEGTAGGYDIEFLTAPHGSGPHIHLGAEYTGGETPGFTSAVSSGGGSYVPDSGGYVPSSGASESPLVAAALERTAPDSQAQLESDTGPSKGEIIMNLLNAPTPSVSDPTSVLEEDEDELLKLLLGRRV